MISPGISADGGRVIGIGEKVRPAQTENSSAGHQQCQVCAIQCLAVKQCLGDAVQLCAVLAQSSQGIGIEIAQHTTDLIVDLCGHLLSVAAAAHPIPPEKDLRAPALFQINRSNPLAHSVPADHPMRALGGGGQVAGRPGTEVRKDQLLGSATGQTMTNLGQYAGMSQNLLIF